MNIQHSNTAPFKADQLVLIVDHYRVGQRIALMQLQYFGLTAHVVNSCRQAIKAVRKRHYALVMIGWDRPECDGTACVNFVRKQEQRRNTDTTIVAVVAYAQPGDKTRCLAAGIDELMSKPITMSDMQEMLAKHLRAAA